jgi:hypothetical protein
VTCREPRGASLLFRSRGLGLIAPDRSQRSRDDLTAP